MFENGYSVESCNSNSHNFKFHLTLSLHRPPSDVTILGVAIKQVTKRDVSVRDNQGCNQ